MPKAWVEYSNLQNYNFYLNYRKHKNMWAFCQKQTSYYFSTYEFNFSLDLSIVFFDLNEDFFVVFVALLKRHDQLKKGIGSWHTVWSHPASSCFAKSVCLCIMEYFFKVGNIGFLKWAIPGLFFFIFVYSVQFLI